MERFRSVLGEAPRNHPADVCADYTSSCRGWADWHFAERNPFHYSLLRVIDRYVDSPPPAPDALDAFRYASPDKLRKVLTEAGAIASSERLLQYTMQAPISVEDFLAMRLEMSDKLREQIGLVSKEQSAEVNRQALESLREY